MAFARLSGGGGASGRMAGAGGLPGAHVRLASAFIAFLRHGQETGLRAQALRQLQAPATGPRPLRGTGWLALSLVLRGQELGKSRGVRGHAGPSAGPILPGAMRRQRRRRSATCAVCGLAWCPTAPAPGLGRLCRCPARSVAPVRLPRSA
eukprot:4285790-Alexandrium_andersonii.AAC.1